MLTITNVTQPDSTKPQLLQVTCAVLGSAPGAPLSLSVKCWAKLSGNEVTTHITATLQDSVWTATLDLLELGSNYYANTTYGIYASTNVENTNTTYTTLT